MALNTENTAQVRITNVTAKTVDVISVPKVLSIKASRLFDYIKQLIGEADKVYTPNKSKEFDHLPLLSVWDLADTGEEVIFNKKKDLPTKTVLNSKGVPILIIIPEDDLSDIGINKFQHLKAKQLAKMEEHVKNIPAKANKMKVSEL